MQPALDPLARMLALKTDLLLNTLDGVTDDEARHLGQAAFVRRQLGHPAMSYRRKPVAAG